MLKYRHMSKNLLDTLSVLAETTKAQLEQQLTLIETIKSLASDVDCSPKTSKPGRKVKNSSSKRTAKPRISEAEKLINEIVALCSDAPYTKQDLIERTGASESRVKNSLTRIKGKEFPQYKLENLGNARRARWFVRLQ